MNFIRIGEVDLSDLGLRPIPTPTDGSFYRFELSNLSIINRAHFYDDVKMVRINVYVTYMVRANCIMESGNIVRMGGRCTPDEYQTLKELYMEAVAC